MDKIKTFLRLKFTIHLFQRCIGLALVILVFNPCFSLNRYWVGSGSGNWNNVANWSDASGGITGFSIPGIADTVIFDGGNNFNCTIDVPISVRRIWIGPLYSGTISYNAGQTTTVGVGGFMQEGGTYIGNNGNITINGAITLTGGLFTSTTGILQVTGGFTLSAGTFNHNNGTISFSNAQTITGNAIFYNILFGANGVIYTIASGTTISSINNVTILGTNYYIINTGTIAIKKDLTLTSSSNHPSNGGTATFLFDGAGDQNIQSPISSILIGTNEKICALPNVELNKISGSLNLSGLINLNGTSWKTTAGALLINPGTSTVNIISSLTFSGEHLTLYHIHIFATSQLITLSPASYMLTSTYRVTINGLSYYQVNTGILQILGDLFLINTSTSAFNAGTGTFLFSGTGVQTINSSASSLNFVCSIPNVIINKTSGILNLIGIINFNGSSWNTIAGSSLINAGTSVVNLLKHTTLSGQNLTLYDITITGNFSITTISSGLTWTSTHLITFAGESNWYQVNTGTLNAKGDVLVTNTNTSGNVGGTAILLLDGTANQTITGSGIAGGGRLPHVQINKTAGILTLSNNLISIDVGWTYVAGTVDAITNTSTVDFYRTSIIDGQGTTTTMAFNNIIISGVISLGGNLDINGDFTIRLGITNRLDVTSLNNYQLNLAGNWTNLNSETLTSFHQQSGKVVFDGGAAQSLTLALLSHIETFYYLEIENTSTGLTLNAPIAISNRLNFILGKITTSATTILTLLNTAIATGASNAGFVSGPVAKTGNQAFIFPVGKNAFYAPLAISAPLVNTNQFTAEYFQADPYPLYDVSLKSDSLKYISRCEYWALNRTSGTSSVRVDLSWDSRSCNITNLSDLRVARWDGAQWVNHGNGGTTGTTSNGTVMSSGVVVDFSPFTLASINLVAPLPMVLIEFKAHCEDIGVVLNWTTATEINTDYFNLERSANAKDWQVAGHVESAGYSMTQRIYSFVDISPIFGITYYRLKQMDQDGNYKYTQPIKLDPCTNGFLENDINIYPNPSTGTFNLRIHRNAKSIHSMEIFNIFGIKILQVGTDQIAFDMSNFQTGIYFVQILAGANRIIKKIKLEK